MEIKQKKIARSVFVVKEKIFVTPHYIRIVLRMSDKQIDQFRNVSIGDHNKIFIPAEGIFNINADDEGIWDADLFVAKRTYTTRNIDVVNKEMWIDFVAHGDNGAASYWAQHAVKGSVLGVAMKERNKPLLREADEYLLIGDSTSLPVIGAMVEQLPAGVNVNAIIEVYSKEDEIKWPAKAGFNIEWLHNPHPENGSSLATTVKNKLLPQGKRFVFIAAEYATVKDLRNYLKEEKGWSSEEYAAASYWKCGSSEDQSSLLRKMERSS